MQEFLWVQWFPKTFREGTLRKSQTAAGIYVFGAVFMEVFTKKSLGHFESWLIPDVILQIFIQ